MLVTVDRPFILPINRYLNDFVDKILSKMIDSQRIDEIRRRWEAASEGPWECIIPEGEEWTQQAKDYEFMANAWVDIRDLLEHVKGIPSE